MPFSSVCFGSSFLLSASKSRRPSFEAKIACSMLMVPTFVPVAPVVAAATAGLGEAAEGDADAGDGDAGDAEAGDADAGDADALVWARAATETVKTRARRILTNLLVIGSVELLGKWFRNYSECLSTYAGQRHKVYLAVNQTSLQTRKAGRISQPFTPNPGGV